MAANLDIQPGPAAFLPENQRVGSQTGLWLHRQPGGRLTSQVKGLCLDADVPDWPFLSD